MKAIRTVYSAAALDAYRSGMTGENLGWAVRSEPGLSFRPVHRIECHAEDGPVVILGDTVFEVDPDTDDVFASDEQAMDAYYNQKGNE